MSMWPGFSWQQSSSVQVLCITYSYSHDRIPNRHNLRREEPLLVYDLRGDPFIMVERHYSSSQLATPCPWTESSWGDKCWCSIGLPHVVQVGSPAQAQPMSWYYSIFRAGLPSEEALIVTCRGIPAWWLQLQLVDNEDELSCLLS